MYLRIVIICKPNQIGTVCAISVAKFRNHNKKFYYYILLIYWYLPPNLNSFSMLEQNQTWTSDLIIFD